MVVHNGIIENYLELRDHLQAKGRSFLSETDTEIIMHQICTALTAEPPPGLGDVCRHLAEKVDGSYEIRSDPPLLVPLRELAAGHNAEEIRGQVHASLADGDFPQAGELFAVAFRKQDGQWLMAGRQPLARTPTMPPALGD